MSEYMIMTDSTVDLPKEYLTEELGVPYIPLTYNYIQYTLFSAR